MLGNDQIETLAERLLRGITKQCSRGAVPPDDFARAVCIDDSICDLIEDSVSQLGPVFHGQFFRFRSCRFERYSSAGERSALRRMRVALQTARSSDRTRSLAPVSKKREYFGVRLETFGDSGPQFAEYDGSPIRTVSRRSDHGVDPSARELAEIANLHPVVANDRPKNIRILR
jgi:hypothetical protein